MIMKKTYITPALIVVNTSTSCMIATSLKINSGVSGGNALIKSEGDWDIWGSDEVDFDEE